MPRRRCVIRAPHADISRHHGGRAKVCVLFSGFTTRGILLPKFVGDNNVPSVVVVVAAIVSVASSLLPAYKIMGRT